ncbi:uncharacterized protein LOC126992596 [Eriocheir sinensis]|uniref:uncharacterized protein LOC126992596 n=1 Tax=Eriocheir sinensis TaxID=95602 RepID=UPI0021C78DC3|nr:uncharacterized protein LOC126990254 isoform X1 [Eriocheir sinensis]XP_050707369.1 uncharacterized protein LOC126992596 [Eriocheir sinensis]
MTPTGDGLVTQGMEDTALQWLSERLGHPDNFTSVIFLPRPRPGAPLHEEVNLHYRRDERRGGTAAPGGAAAPPTPASCPSASSRCGQVLQPSNKHLYQSG